MPMRTPASARGSSNLGGLVILARAHDGEKKTIMTVVMMDYDGDVDDDGDAGDEHDEGNEHMVMVVMMGVNLVCAIFQAGIFIIEAKFKTR